MLHHLHRFTLEVSAKPFHLRDERETREKLRDIFLSWYAVLKHADEVALLWWFGDGAEILEFSGDLDQPVEWAKWMGFAEQKFRISNGSDPNLEALHGADWLYHPEAGEITIRDMQRFLVLAREAAQEVLGKRLSMGIAFDPGNEFTKSTFRYERHPELLISNGGALSCIDATASLHRDDQSYAAFPDGIPEGTPFGEFFGKQTRAFFGQVDFDFIWLSNSFGFGRSPYASGGTGEFFDGEQFHFEHNHEVRDAVMEFWHAFRRECPDIRVACRGTDFTTGFNLISQATPYRRLYHEIQNLTPPPNTPWPALTRNHGLALVGMLSQIAAWPGAEFPYRFYLSDPWWLNSPWIDRYQQNPRDIYLTTALSRVTGEGRLDRLNEVSLLSIDTSWGELPENFSDTLIPHLKRGLEERPDRPGPVVWVYPFEEFDEAVFETKQGGERLLCNDANLIQAINRGLPLSSVVTARALARLEEATPGYFEGCVLVSIVPTRDEIAFESALLAHVERGGRLLCYGPTRHCSERMRQALGIASAPEIHLADVTRVETQPLATHALETGAWADRLADAPLLSGGGIGEAPGQAEVVAEAIGTNGDRRALATCRSLGPGRLAWTRGISSIAGYNRRMEAREVTDCFPAEMLYRELLARLGWQFHFTQEAPDSRNYYTQVHRSKNGFILTATVTDPTLELTVDTPFGAPLFPGMTNRIEPGGTRLTFAMQEWFHGNARLFVTGQTGRIPVHLGSGTHHPRYRQGWFIEDLENATLRLFPWSGCFDNTQILLNPNQHNTLGEPFDGEWKEEGGQRFLEMRNITGRVSFLWSNNDDPMPKAVRDLREE